MDDLRYSWESETLFARAPEPQDAAQDSGILYIEDFDAPPPAPEPPPPAAEITESVPLASHLAACAAAREAGRAEGRNASLQDAMVLQGELRNAALAAIADALAMGTVPREEAAASRAGALARHMLSLLEATLPALAARHAPQEVGALLEAVLPGLRAEPDLEITVHPDVLGAAQAAMAGMPGAATRRWVVKPDPALGVADAKVEWQDGAVLRDTAALWRAIRAALAAWGVPQVSEAGTAREAGEAGLAPATDISAPAAWPAARELQHGE